MPFDSSATPTTATNSATYLVNSRLRILAGCGAAAGAAAAAASREASSVRPCGASGCSEMLIPAKLARRGVLVSCRNGRLTRSDPEMLAQFQALGLIVRADLLAVHGVGPRQHLFIDQPADDLAMLEDERHLARAHLQHRARPLPAGAGIAEAGVEEAGIVHPEFADQGIERHHLGGVIRRHLHGFLGGQDVELAGVEDQAAVGPCR